VFLIFCLTITLIFAKEVPYKGNQNLPTKANGEVEAEATGPLAVFKGFKNLPPGMPSVLLVTGLTWVRHAEPSSLFTDFRVSDLTEFCTDAGTVLAALVVPVHPLRHRLDGP